MALGTKATAAVRLAPGGSATRNARSAARPPRGDGTEAAIGGLILEPANVLYDATLWRREVVRLLGRLHVPATYPEFFQRWDRDYLVDVQQGFRQYDEAFGAFLLSAGLSWGQIDEVEAFARQQRHDYEENVRPLPAVVATLTELARRGLPLVALCDASHPAAALERRIERLGLGGLFLKVLSSLELGAAKPAAACYRAALDVLELPASEVAFVGCDRRSLDGAAACRLRTIALNCQEPVQADARLSSFAELVDLVEEGFAVGDREVSS